MKILSFFSILFLVLFLSCNSDEVKPENLTSCFEAPEAIEAGVPAEFSSACSENASTYFWEFGTAGTSSDPNPTFTFPSQGSYEVSLTIFSAEGDSASSSQTLEVGETPASAITDHFGDITQDEVWGPGKHRIFGFVNILDATVTIEPGAVVVFSERGTLNVGTGDGVTEATLIANGTASQQILFTADTDTPVKGYWNNINFGSGQSGNSSMEYCTIEYGGADSSYETMISSYGQAISFNNNTVRYSSTTGIRVYENGFKSFNSNKVTDCGSFVMDIDPSSVHSIGSNNIFEGEQGIQIMNIPLTVSSTTWQKQNIPYVINGTIRVGSATGTHLTIESGTKLKFNTYGTLLVGQYADSLAVLTAEGTASDSIYFLPVKEKNDYDSRWKNLKFGPGAQEGSSIAYARIEHTSGTISTGYGGLMLEGAAVAINNTYFLDAGTYGVYCDEEGRFLSFENNVIHNDGRDGISIHANWVHTIGNTNSIIADHEILVQKDIIEHSAVTWKKQPFPYTIYGLIDLGTDNAGGSMLNIEAGSTIAFVQRQSIQLYSYGSEGGGIIANGTAEEPITFTSAKDSQQPGDWERISLGSKTKEGTIFNHCIFEYGGNYNAPLEIGYTDVPVITNCIFRNNKEYGLLLQRSSPTMSGNVFENNPSGDILLLE
jgi:hypothetical protein